MRNIHKLLLGIFISLPYFLLAQWQILPNPNPNVAWQVFELHDQLLVSDGLGLATTADGGVHWQRITADGPFGRVMPSGNDLYGIRNNLTTGLKTWLKTSDAGQNWDTLASFFMFEPTAMAEANGCIYVLTNLSGQVATVEVFNLATQQLTQLGYFESNNGRSFDLKVCGDAAFFASDRGLIRYKNCGAVVDTFFPNVQHTLLAVKGDTVFSANDSLDFVYSTNFGDTWQSIPHQGAWAIPQKLFFLNDEPWMVSSDFVPSCDVKLWRLDNSLDNGTQMFSLRDRCINDIVALDNGHFVVATSAGMMTANWPENVWLTNNTGLGVGQLFIKAQDGILLEGPPGNWGNLYSADLGETWSFPVLDHQFNYNLNGFVKKDSFYYASLSGGSLWRSTDLKNWDSIALGISPLEKVGRFLMTLAANWQIMLSQDGITWNLTTGYLPGTQSRFATDEHYMFVIQNPTGVRTLARSSDFGMTWVDPGLGLLLSNNEEVLDFSVNGPDIYALVFDYVQLEQKGFYVSHDYGNQWKFVPAPSNDLINHPFTSNGNVFYVTNGKQIWATSNDGELWGTLDLGDIQGPIVNIAVEHEHLFVSTPNNPWRRPVSGIDIQQYSGTVFNDLNYNGLRDTLEPGIPGAIIHVSGQNWYTTTDSLGYYQIISELLHDTISVVKPIEHCSILPPFVLTGDGFLKHDFALQLQPNITDVSISAANTQVFRPGFETDVVVTIQNEGTKSVLAAQVLLSDLTGTLSLQFLESDPPPSSIVGDSLIWDDLNLGVFEQKSLHLRFKTPSNVNLDVPVKLPVSIRAAGDTLLANNDFTLIENIVSSFDPNDKRVQPDTLALAGLSTTDLRYTIRFQNTGNFQADFVTILDTLPKELDLSSLKILGASHPCSWRILDGHVLAFLFKPINLPDSLTDEPGSHGFVQFSIRAKGDLPLGMSILNRAAIYFDFNPPVLTDYSSMHLLEPTVHTAAVAAGSRLLLWPNPASTVVFLEKDDDSAAWLEVYSSDGRKVFSQQTFGSRSKLPVSEWPDGFYVINWRSTRKQWAGKLLKN